MPAKAPDMSPAPAHKQIYLQGNPEDHADRIDPMALWRSIAKHKGIILLLGLLMALLAGAIVYSKTPIYRSTATVLIESSKPKVVSIEDVYGNVAHESGYFQTQMEIIKSREIGIKAITSLELWNDPEFDPRIRKEKPWDGLLEILGLAKKPSIIEWTDAMLADAVYGKFSQRLRVEPAVRLSQLVKISFESASPALAAEVANTVVNTYIENDLQGRFEMNRKANQWLQAQVGALKLKLEDSERALQQYREEKGLVDTKGLAQSGAGVQVEGVTQRLIEARLRRAEAESAYLQIRDAKTLDDLSSIPAVLRDPSVGKAKADLAQAERRFSEISQRYGYEHPDYISARAEAETDRNFLKRQVDIVVASLTREYQAARSVERALAGTLSAAKSSVQNINRNEFELGVLEREVDSNRQLYEMFMNRIKETSISSDLQTTNARLTDPAVKSKSPVKPKKSLIIAVALMMGLVLGVLIALLRDRLDNSIKTTDEVESRLLAPLLTTVPLLRKRDRSAIKSSRIILDQPQSHFAESIRTAMTGVLLSAIDQPNRILLVTSSLPGEGKTTLAINLALALAHAQTKRTLLIECDLRRPSIAKNLTLPEDAKGLSNLVVGTAELEECLQTIEGSPLSIMTAGQLPANPLELLLSNRFKYALEYLAAQFDIIVIDSPPVELVSDALVLAAHATGVIHVVKAQETPYQLVRKGIRRIKSAEGELVGVALTHFDFKKAQMYHGEYSGYGEYSQGYGHAYSVKALAEARA